MLGINGEKSIFPGGSIPACLGKSDGLIFTADVHTNIRTLTLVHVPFCKDYGTKGGTIPYFERSSLGGLLHSIACMLHSTYKNLQILIVSYPQRYPNGFMTSTAGFGFALDCRGLV